MESVRGNAKLTGDVSRIGAAALTIWPQTPMGSCRVYAHFVLSSISMV